MTKIVAHRGYLRVAPENTLPAFAAALAYSPEVLEIDVQMTKDGYLVVIHDDTVDRTTNGHGQVRHLTCAEITALDAGAYKEPVMTGVTVPTFATCLAFLQEQNFTGELLIELKTDEYDYPGIEAAVVAAVAEQQWSFTVVYQSFNLATLKRLHALAPTTEQAALVYWPNWRTYWYRWRGIIQRIHPAMRFFRKRSARQWRRPLQWMPWTVNDSTELERVFAAGLPGVITNEVAEAARLRERYRKGEISSSKQS